MLYFFIIFIIIYFSLSLKLDLIDNYFVNVYIGKSRANFKLLIDPTYPLTYILKPYNSKYKISSDLNPLLFTNIYGNYSAKWSVDKFYFKEENFTMEMKFLDVYYKKRNFLNADGILGLGAYKNSDSRTNIFYYLNKHQNNSCLKNNMTIYDKKENKLFICEPSYISTKTNKISVPFDYDKKYNEGVISISKINLIPYKKELSLNNIYNNEAFIGITPLIIFPKDVNKWISDSYIEEENQKISSFISHTNIIYEDEEIIEKIPINFMIENNEYIYENCREKNFSFIKSFLNLEEFGNIFKNNISKFYLGLFTDNIERVEFDYDKKRMNIFIYTYKYMLIRIIIFIFAVGFFIFAILTVFQKKNERNQKIDNDQELIDL